MGSLNRISGLRFALVALSILAASPVAAQEAAPAADPELSTYAKAFLAVGLVRDDFNAQLALAKNKTVEHQAEIREQMKVKIEETIRAAGLTPEAYRRIEYTVTVDGARRAAFDKLLEELSKQG